MGRLGRVIAGAAGLFWITWSILGDEHGPLLVAAGTLAVAGAAALVYFGAYRALVDRVKRARDGWLASLLLLGPLYALFLVGVGPSWLYLGLGAYISFSLIVAAFIGYGGCEVVALPTLVGGRRMVAYCPWNAVDAVERPLSRARGALGLSMAGLTLVVGGYFVLFQVVDVLDGRVVPAVDPIFASILVVPVAYLGWRAAGTLRDGGRLRGALAPGLGAAVLLYLTAIFVFHLDTTWMWVPVMMTGATGALFVWLRQRSNRREAGTLA